MKINYGATIYIHAKEVGEQRVTTLQQLSKYYLVAINKPRNKRSVFQHPGISHCPQNT